MTAVLDAWSDVSVSTPLWRSPQPDLWVSSAQGEYQGMIEHLGKRFVAVNRQGKTVGEFDSLPQAQRAVETWSPLNTDLREVVLLKAIAAAALMCSAIAGFSLIF
ncbi:hypothetical protein B0I08_105188 [Glaciihabitans tibetensis]|uniref:Uncharacterized protein n=1 Tax=Glaciihabitans tibetensis TaxID=1266600 RepID=A0A2T0VD13_9MICO|nr:hypothetical protein [Glaciihabitans tibetensis]PRY68024.1 hypothetical protein B0I08_105188 [Glaciihabitans tibetensis]